MQNLRERERNKRVEETLREKIKQQCKGERVQDRKRVSKSKGGKECSLGTETEPVVRPRLYETTGLTVLLVTIDMQTAEEF